MTALILSNELPLHVGLNVIVRAGDRVRFIGKHEPPGGMPTPPIVAPQDWVALTGPCPTCDGQGWRWTHGGLGGQIGIQADCPDCRDRRRIVPLYTEPTCQQPSERDDGTLCGSDYEVALVDVARYEGDGESTFFHLPICYGHRLALGEHVVAYEPCSRVLVGRGSIEVVPVWADTHPDHDPMPDHLCQRDIDGKVTLVRGGQFITPFMAFDPLPVPGRDWGIVIDCVEVTP